MDDLISRQPEQRTLTEDDYAYCTECDHVEMCRWYPMYGCEFKSRPSAQPERQVELVGTESNIEILSELRAQFNCFDEVEEPVYRALTDAICALSTQPDLQKCLKCIFKPFKQFQTERKKGRWIDLDDHVMCSCCGATHYGADKNYCPNCGADCRGEDA